MSRTYRVSCYAREDFSEGRGGFTAAEAIDYADRWVMGHGIGAAHIWAEGSDNGIYIARPADGERSTREERIATLENMQFRNNAGEIL